MCNKDDRLVIKGCHDTILQRKSGMCIDSAERIIKEVDVGAIVDGSRKLNPLLLTSTHVQTSLPDLRQVAMGEILHHLMALSYSSLFIGFPNRMLSRTVPLWIHGVCGT
uniref:Uncharacterized protein n=1 Tax=Oryza punctata TaxID=4537 RepID=A0A0E0KZH1_ORYPU